MAAKKKAVTKAKPKAAKAKEEQAIEPEVIDSSGLPAPTAKQKQTAERVLARLAKEIKGMNTAFYDVAVDILEAYDGKYAEICGYPNFQSYVEDNLAMAYRTAMDFKECGRAIKELGIEKSRVESIGWSKFKELVPHLDEAKALPPARQEKAIDKLLEKGENMSVRKLHDELRRTPAKAATQEKMRLNLQFVAQESSVVTDALQIAYDELGATDPSAAILHIASEWMSYKGEKEGMTPLKDMLKYIEKKYGVKLSLVKGEADAAPKAAEKTEPKATGKKKGKEKDPDPPAPAAEPEEETVTINPDEMSKAEMLKAIEEYEIDIPGAKKMTEKSLRAALNAALESSDDATAGGDDPAAGGDDGGEESIEDLLGLNDE